MPIIDEMKEKVKKVSSQGYKFVKKYQGETICISLAVIAVASLTAAYFLSPAYATFVGTVGTKAATLVNPAITAMSNFAFAHPLIASLIVLAAVAALITVPVYAYKNSNTAAQVEKVAEVLNNSNITEPDTKLNNIKQILGLGSAQAVN